MAASRGADCPKSVVCTVVSALMGYAVSIDASPFRADRDGLSSDTFPRLCFKKAGSSSRELGSPPEFVVPTSAGYCTGAFLGVSILFATSIQRVHSRRASQARLCSARSVSRALDGLLLAVSCGLVSSRCHVQDSRSRGFLPRLSRTTSSVTRPSAPLAPAACRRFPDDASHLHVDLEVLIRVEIRSIRGLFRPVRHPRPLLRFAPSGFAPPVLEAWLPPPPLGL
jgi:hypothetical protein